MLGGALFCGELLDKCQPIAEHSEPAAFGKGFRLPSSGRVVDDERLVFCIGIVIFEEGIEGWRDFVEFGHGAFLFSEALCESRGRRLGRLGLLG